MLPTNPHGSCPLVALPSHSLFLCPTRMKSTSKSDRFHPICNALNSILYKRVCPTSKLSSVFLCFCFSSRSRYLILSLSEDKLGTTSGFWRSHLCYNYLAVSSNCRQFMGREAIVTQCQQFRVLHVGHLGCSFLRNRQFLFHNEVW